MGTSERIISSYNKNTEVWRRTKNTAHENLEKPAMYRKLPELRGKDVLCIGCGTGEECAYIKGLGVKEVIGIDISERMIETSRKEDPSIEFKIMDMEELSFPEDSFDFIYSSLCLHYAEDWRKTLKGVNRILKKNGKFLFSTHNPIYWGAEVKRIYGNKIRMLGSMKKGKKKEVIGDYLKTRKINDTWGKTFKVTYYHKPFHKMINEIKDSGFEILSCDEPSPLRSLKGIDPWLFNYYRKIPPFIIFELGNS